MAGDPNINSPQWDHELADPPFRSRVMRVAHRAGAQHLGATLYEIDPGGALSPYHAHHGNEELLVVLSGTPRLRTPDGVRELEPGAVVAFPCGADGAHSIANAGDAAGPARLLLVSTMRFPDVAEHLDTGTWLAVTGPREGKAFPAGTDMAPIEAVVRAMEAGAAHDHGE
ncbi:MAG: cupin domain-containing protein [Solirubrobacteraceae bacterium]